MSSTANAATPPSTFSVSVFSFKSASFAANADFVASAANEAADFEADSCGFKPLATSNVDVLSVAATCFFAPSSPFLASPFFAVVFGFFESPPNQPRTRANKPPDFSFFAPFFFSTFSVFPSALGVFASVGSASVAAIAVGKSAFFPTRFPEKKSKATQPIVKTNEPAIATPIVFFATRIQSRPSNSSLSSSVSSSTTLDFAFFASSSASSKAPESSQSSSSSPFFRFNNRKGAVKTVEISFKYKIGDKNRKTDFFFSASTNSS